MVCVVPLRLAGRSRIAPTLTLTLSQQEREQSLSPPPRESWREGGSIQASLIKPQEFADMGGKSVVDFVVARDRLLFSIGGILKNIVAGAVPQQ